MSRLEALSRTILLSRDWVAPRLTDAAISERLQNTVVRITADEQWVSAGVGQSVVVTLATLIARMGVQVELEIPEVRLLGSQRPVTGDHLISGLLDLGDDLIPGTSIKRASTSPDLRFVLGSASVDDFAVPTWRLTSTDWAARIQRISWHADPCPHEVACAVPIGGMAAAALASAEVFKHVVNMLPPADPFFRKFLLPMTSAQWNFGDTPALPQSFDLGRLTIVSAGAITQSALFALFRLANVSADASLFENDLTALSNVNRNMLTRRSDVDYLKTSVAVANSPKAFRMLPVNRRFTAEDEVHGSERALIGVDDIPSRWDVQRAQPRWLGIGATSHVEVSCSSHVDGQACAGCLHHTDEPNDAPIPTVSFVSFWAGLCLAARLVRDVCGVPYGADRQHLWLSPLRMDEIRLAWSPVVPHLSCPVGCHSSRRVQKSAS
jgi:hypothetical protein